MEIGFCFVRSLLRLFFFLFSSFDTDIILSVFMWTWCSKHFFLQFKHIVFIGIVLTILNLLLTTWTKIFLNMIRIFFSSFAASLVLTPFQENGDRIKKRWRVFNVHTLDQQHPSISSLFFALTADKYGKKQHLKAKKKEKKNQHDIIRWCGNFIDEEQKKISLIEKCQTRIRNRIRCEQP